MLTFLPAFLLIPLGLLILLTNTVLHCTPLFILAFVKFLLPVHGVRVFLSRVLILIAESWIAVNSFTLRVLTRIEWDVQGMNNLEYDGHYLVLSNHQSWVDIPVLQKVFNKKIPFLKFFLKQELLWVPLLGLAWWALDFPFMKRHTKEFLEKHPEHKGKDLETTRQACEKFRHVPVSVMNFVEGTRYTDAKREQQQSPFIHLLKPKAGGVGFVINAMGNMLKSVIDVTIVYPEGRPTFIDLLAGRVHRITVHIRELPIPRELIGGDYENDTEYRKKFQLWITEVWNDKDALINRLKKTQPSSRNT